MAKIIMVCLIVVGLINFIPVIGVLSFQKLESSYSISLISNDLIILMRHRALLFGVLGGFVLYSAFVESYQGAAIVMVGISMIGFALLTFLVGEFNQSIFRVLIADIVGITFLSIAVVSKYVIKSS